MLRHLTTRALLPFGPVRSGLLFVALLGLIGCSDTSINTNNSPPGVAILEPADGASVAEGRELSFVGSVTDRGTPNEQLQVFWTSSIDGTLFEGSADEEGRTTFTLPGLSPGEHLILLRAVDAQGASGTHEVRLEVFVNGPPEIEVIAPLASASYYTDEAIALQSIVGDTEDLAEDLRVSWKVVESGQMLVDGLVPASTGASSFASLFEEGTWLLEATVTDSGGRTATDQVTFTVGPPNSPPDCAIDSPESGSVVPASQAILFEGAASDPDIPSDQLVFELESSLDGLLGAGSPTSDGTWTLPAGTLSPGVHSIMLTVRDDREATCVLSSLLTLSTPPTASLMLPTGSETLNDGDSVLFEGLVQDGEDPAASLAAVWESDIQGVLGNSVPDAVGSVVFSEALIAGTHLVSLTATDSTGLAGTDTVVLWVNEAPSAPVVEMSPASPSVLDALGVSFLQASADPDGAPAALTYDYEWSLNGVVQGAYAGWNTIPSTATSRGDLWEVTVVASDGQAVSPPGSASVLIGNGAPSVVAASVSPTVGSSSDVFTVTPTGWSDPDGDPEGYTYQWYGDGVLLPGAQGSSFSPVGLPSIAQLTCEVTPFDGLLSGPPVMSTPALLNTPPTVSGVLLTPSTAYETTTLQASYGSTFDADGHSVTVSWQWFSSGLPLPGATGNTLDGASFGKGDLIHVEATPNDGFEDGSAGASVPITIQNSPPSVVSVSVTPSSGTEATTFSCSASGAFDADPVDAVSFLWSWSVNGLVVANSQTLTGADFDAGDSVECAATPTDGSALGSSVTSLPVVVANTAPSGGYAQISPGAGSEATVFSCLGAGATDPDPSDIVTYDYSWTVNGAGPFLGSTIDGASFDSGDSLICFATPTDGLANGLPSASLPVVVSGSPPSITSVAINPGQGDATTPFDCVPSGWSDPDGDPESYLFAWFVNGNQVASSANLAGMFGRGDTVVCAATPMDASTQGAQLFSPMLVVGNAAPSLVSASISPTAGGEDTVFTCSPAGAQDVDGDPVSFTWAWTVNGVPTGASQTIDGNDFDKGDTIVCSATPSDGTDSGPTVVSGSVVVSNTAPSLTGVDIVPDTAAYADTNFSAVAQGWSDVDPADSTPSVDYSWTVNGSPVGTNSPVLAPGPFGRGDTVVVTATPTDGAASGSPVTSASVVILNSPPTAPGVSISPSNPAVMDDLFCSVHTPSTDADGDPVTYSYLWTLSSSPVSSSQSIPWYYTSANDTVECTVTPDDGWVQGTPGVVSEAITFDLWPHVALGRYHSCVLQYDSSYSCWGRNSEGQLASSQINLYGQLTAGELFSCALVFGTTTVDCWGDNSANQLSIPNSPFVQIEAGTEHVCGLIFDGTVECWGSADFWTSTPPTQRSIEVTSGDEFSCALLETGDIECWNTSLTASPGPWIQISAGRDHLCAVNIAGDIECWGDDSYGQSSPPPNVQFNTVSAGWNHTCGVEMGTGIAYCWGDNSAGQLSGIPSGFFETVEASWNHSCGHRASGVVECWGCGAGTDQGQCAP